MAYTILGHILQLANDGVYGCSFASTGNAKYIYTQFSIPLGFMVMLTDASAGRLLETFKDCFQDRDVFFVSTR
jgi:hypothetical protein